MTFVLQEKTGGVAIGVLSGVSQEADFCGEADYILNSVGELPQLLETDIDIKEALLWLRFS